METAEGVHRRRERVGCSTRICLIPRKGSEIEKRLQQVICYRVGDETERLHLEERSKRPRSAVSLPASLACEAGIFQLTYHFYLHLFLCI